MKQEINFQKIPQLTYGNYQISVGLKFLEKQLEQLKEECNLDLNPEFQRGYVWTESQKEKYIEFILKGGKTSKEIYFNCPDYMSDKPYDVNDPILNRMVIVDGKQRLSSVLGFLRNEVMAFGSYFKDFKGTLRQHHKIDFCIAELTTREDILNWYLDFNSGGTVHSQKELDKVKELINESKKLVLL